MLPQKGRKERKYLIVFCIRVKSSLNFNLVSIIKKRHYGFHGPGCGNYSIYYKQPCFELTELLFKSIVDLLLFSTRTNGKSEGGIYKLWSPRKIEGMPKEDKTPDFGKKAFKICNNRAIRLKDKEHFISQALLFEILAFERIA